MIDSELTGDPVRPAFASYAAMFAVACTALLYEILITRLTSAILLYHFTFLALSIAMLGLGAPGIWYALYPPSQSALVRSLLAAGAAVPLSIVVIFKLGIYLTKGEDVTVSGLPMLVLCSALVPMLALGSAICLLLIEAKGQRVGRMYAADLCGAGVGALAVIPLMKAIETPYLLACSGLLPLGAAVLVERKLRAHAAVLAALLACSVAWGKPYALRYNRVYIETEPSLFERWTPTGRITVRPKDKRLEAYVLGAQLLGEGSKYKPVPGEHLWILQEGGAGTTLTRLSSSPAALAYLRYDVTGVGYQVFPPKRACVIGPGGGRDVLTALHFGAEHVDAVELHPEVIDAVRGPFGAYSGHLYDMPRVRPIVSEGRSFLERTSNTYDFIQISMVDSWAATTAGAFALSENYLYTTEAMRTYLSRLQRGGVLSLTRFYVEGMVIEAVRLAYMALRALELEGVTDPLAHIAAVNAGNKFTLLVSRDPFTPEQINRLAAACEERGFLQLYPPGRTTPREATFTRAVAIEPRPTAALGRDLTPPTDDRPYFFQSASLFSTQKALGPDITFNEQAVLLLRFLLTTLALFCLVFFFLPFMLRGKLPRHPGFARGSVYFGAIGLGFMFVESALIQRFIVYLGHPSYAITVVLTAMLLAAGAGSSFTAKATPARLAPRMLAAPVSVIVISLLISEALPSTLGASFSMRVAISLVLLAPVGFTLGFGLPSGMLRFGADNRAWFWAVNGATSVLGSVLAVVLSMTAGFATVTLAGAALYLGAYALLASGLAAPGRA